MTKSEFRKLVGSNRRDEAIEAVMLDFVRGCLDDGPEEIARVLSIWATHTDRTRFPQLDLGDDELILEHAEWYGTVRTPKGTGGRSAGSKPSLRRNHVPNRQGRKDR